MRRLQACLNGLELPASTRIRAVTQLECYVNLLKRWNRANNLVAKRDLADMDRFESRHLIDSVSLFPWISGSHIDVGSGGGLPAIPLAILRPGERTTLVERSTRKSRFLQQVALELELDVEVMACDAKALDRTADVVTARAVAPLEALWPLVRPVVAPDGILLLQTSAPVTESSIDVLLEPSVEVNGRFLTVVRHGA